jgi:murein DD-endopeptidase MepM/ murein hydrolase activator NlpD
MKRIYRFLLFALTCSVSLGAVLNGLRRPPSWRWSQDYIRDRFQPPVKKGTICSLCGWRIHPEKDAHYAKRRWHYGVDICTARGTSVLAVDDGVAGVRNDKTPGTTVILTHRDDIRSVYGQLHAVKIKDGQTVKKGHAIGTVGRSDHAAGSHLHFEIRRDDGTWLHADDLNIWLTSKLRRPRPADRSRPPLPAKGRVVSRSPFKKRLQQLGAGKEQRRYRNAQKRYNRKRRLREILRSDYFK